MTGDARLTGLALNTLWLVGGTLLVALPLGVLLAVLIAKTDLPGRRVAIALLGLLLLLPLYLQAAAWLAGFGPQGWVTLTAGGPPLLEGWRGAIWIHAVAAIPWVALIVGAGLTLVDPALEEAALLSGSAAQVLTRITLRRAAGAALAAALWVAVTTAGAIAVTDLLGIRTFAEEVYTALALGGWRDELPAFWFGAALTALLALAAGVAVARLAPSARAASPGRGWRAPLGRGRPAAAAVVWLLLLLLAAVPLANLAAQAGAVRTPVEGRVVRGFSLIRCLELMAESPRVDRREVGWSLLIATAAATLAVAIAIPLAWRARRGGRRSLFALLPAALALAVPAPLVGLALIAALNRPELPPLIWMYDNTILAPCLAQAWRALPLPLLLLWHALSGVPRDALEGAAQAGAGSWTQLVRVALPACRLPLAAAWMLAAVVALGELGATLLVSPPGMMTVPEKVFGLLHYGVENRVAALTLAQLAQLAILLGVGAWLLRWGTRRGAGSSLS